MVRTDTERPELIAIRQAGMRFGHRWIFRNVELVVRESEVVGLIGPSGSGKTSLCRCLLGFRELTEGTVWVEGKRIVPDIDSWVSVRRRIGFIQQGLHLWGYRRVIENLIEGPRYGLKVGKHSALRRAVRWARRLRICEHLRKYPGALSGGEQQRVAIGRAMVNGPLALIADEPTANLDPILAGEVGEMIAGLRAYGVGVLLVAHNIDLIRRHSDRTYFLSDGAIQESGPSAEILTEPRTAGLRRFIERVRKGW